MNSAVSIMGASEGVCLLCGSEGPVFEATTPCGRLAALPVCSKDLFIIVVAQNRAIGSATRGPIRGRGKPAVKPRTSTEDSGIQSDSESATGLAINADSSAA